MELILICLRREVVTEMNIVTTAILVEQIMYYVTP
jgi:hypothetical protein